MSVLSIIVSLFLLIPYFGWGIYTLRVRFAHHEEFAVRVEVATLLAVAFFVSLELKLFGVWMANMTLLYVFSALGLFVSTAALYGSMLVSVSSHLIVDIFMPVRQEDTYVPQFGPAEALESVGDFEGALNEYLVMARIFPKDGACALHVAETYAHLDDYAQAAHWFERGLGSMDDPDRYMRITNRLSDMYLNRLDSPDDSVRILEAYLEKFPDTDRGDSVRGRIERVSGPVSVGENSLQLPPSGSELLPPDPLE